MKLRYACYPVLAAALVMACGGSVSKSDDGGGPGSSGGRSSSGGTGSKAGTSSMGGLVGTAGSGTAGTLVVGGTPTCATLGCPAVDCAGDEVPVLEPGACCSTCKPKAGGCEDVKCEPVEDCAEGYELVRPSGACCADCLPKLGSGVSCVDIPCPQTACPLGYIRADLFGGCCYDCVPDPLYCRTSDDCVVADKPRSCCGCPEAITRRQYEAEPCWSAVAAPRMQPVSCFPQVICDEVCGACPSPGEVICSEHRCMERGLGLK